MDSANSSISYIFWSTCAYLPISYLESESIWVNHQLALTLTTNFSTSSSIFPTSSASSWYHSPDISFSFFLCIFYTYIFFFYTYILVGISKTYYYILESASKIYFIKSFFFGKIFLIIFVFFSCIDCIFIYLCKLF
jgi:hypothetical protein